MRKRQFFKKSVNMDWNSIYDSGMMGRDMGWDGMMGWDRGMMG